jgi:CRP-like cAMP-binding protein
MCIQEAAMPAQKTTPLTTETVQPQQCSHSHRLALLAKAPYFASLPAPDLARINVFFQEDDYSPDSPIYFAGQPATRLYMVAAGKVKLIRHTLGGQDVLLDILALGDFFGSLSILGDACYADTAQALTQVCALGIGVQEFQAILLRYPAVAVAVLQVTAQRLQAAHETIRQLSAFPVERRIAAILLALGDKLGEASEHGLLLQVPLTRQELADMAGATVETASRVVSRLEHAGLLHTGRQWIAIADVAGLAALAREN